MCYLSLCEVPACAISPCVASYLWSSTTPDYHLPAPAPARSTGTPGHLNGSSTAQQYSSSSSTAEQQRQETRRSVDIADGPGSLGLAMGLHGPMEIFRDLVLQDPLLLPFFEHEGPQHCMLRQVRPGGVGRGSVMRPAGWNTLGRVMRPAGWNTRGRVMRPAGWNTRAAAAMVACRAEC